jgi:hypothetical protein
VNVVGYARISKARNGSLPAHLLDAANFEPGSPDEEVA